MPVTRKTFEDFPPGTIFELGEYHLTAEDIISYAREYDPQPFHLDEEAGRTSFLGGLAASGWHMVSILMRMTYDNILFDTCSLGSPGVDSLKWTRPVLAGDTLTGKAEVLSARPLKSRPNMGIAKFRFEMHNQRDELVLVQMTSLLVERQQPT